MALRGGSSSSGAGPSRCLSTVWRRQREKRQREQSADFPRSRSKRSRMAESGAEREEEELQEPELSDLSDSAESDLSASDAFTEDEEGDVAAYSQSFSQNAMPEVERSSNICPITDKDEKPFRLMDMPPEIRIEIYRACLTRPFDILLSRENKPADVEKQREEDARRLADSEAIINENDQFSMPPPPPPPPRTSNLPDEAVSDQDTTRAASSSSGSAWSARGLSALRSITRRSLQRNTNRNIDGNNNDAGNANNPDNANNAANQDANINPLEPSQTISPIITDVHNNYRSRNSRGRRTVTFSSRSATSSSSRPPRPQDDDPLHVNLLRTSKLIYKESRAILYGENNFLLDLDTAQPTLAALHQRSRGQIKHLRVTIPTHNEILERFSEVVRLSLRYCWRLRRFIIHTPFVLPGTEGSSTSGNTTVYANAFDILRWLPRQCEVVLEGNVCEEIRRVVEKNSNLAKSLDELAYARRQLISNDAPRLPIGG